MGCLNQGESEENIGLHPCQREMTDGRDTVTCQAEDDGQEAGERKGGREEVMAFCCLHSTTRVCACEETVTRMEFGLN